MDLYLLRHGIAEERSLRGSDSRRALTNEGKTRTLRLARLLKSMGVSFDLILSSSYVRAWETAAIVADTLKAGDRVRETPHLEPGGGQEQLLRHLESGEQTPSSVLLVGHEPDLSALIALLVTGNDAPIVVMKKGALCKLEVTHLRFGKCATLAWLLPPKLTSAYR